MGNASTGENGQRTALSTPHNATFNDHPATPKARNWPAVITRAG